MSSRLGDADANPKATVDLLLEEEALIVGSASKGGLPLAQGDGLESDARANGGPRPDELGDDGRGAGRGERGMSES